MSGFAWVTLATNDSYSLGALVLAHSLKQAGTSHQLAVLVTPGVTNVMRKNLAEVFNVVEEVNLFDSKDETNLKLLKRPELGVTFTKLHCWRLTQFEKCVFLDADVLVLANSDELFEREEFSAAPDVGWPDCFNSGVFVYKPSMETYNKLVEFALQKGSFDGGDQGLLNAYFSDWAHKDISKHLPFIYNMCSTACYSYLPAFKYYGGNVKIVHFIGPAKPWLQYFDTESRRVHPSPDLQHLQEVLQRWWDIFCSLIHPKLTPDMAPNKQAAENLSHSQSHSYPNHNPPSSTYRDNFGEIPNSEVVHQNQESSVYNVWDPWEEYEERASQYSNHGSKNVEQHIVSEIPRNDCGTSETYCDNLSNFHQTNVQENVPEEHYASYTTQTHHDYVEHRPVVRQTFNELIEHKEYVEHPVHTQIQETEVNNKTYKPQTASIVDNRLDNVNEPLTDTILESSSILESHPQNDSSPNPPSSPQIHCLTESLPNMCETSAKISQDASLHTKDIHDDDADSTSQSGLAGAFAQFTLGVRRSPSQDALENHLRRQAWEVGNIDYMGRDSFDNIWNKICQTLSSTQLESVKDGAVSSSENQQLPDVAKESPEALDQPQEIVVQQEAPSEIIAQAVVEPVKEVVSAPVSAKQAEVPKSLEEAIQAPISTETATDIPKQQALTDIEPEVIAPPKIQSQGVVTQQEAQAEVIAQAGVQPEENVVSTPPSAEQVEVPKPQEEIIQTAIITETATNIPQKEALTDIKPEVVAPAEIQPEGIVVQQEAQAEVIAQAVVEPEKVIVSTPASAELIEVPKPQDETIQAPISTETMTDIPKEQVSTDIKAEVIVPAEIQPQEEVAPRVDSTEAPEPQPEVALIEQPVLEIPPISEEVIKPDVIPQPEPPKEAIQPENIQTDIPLPQQDLPKPVETPIQEVPQAASIPVEPVVVEAPVVPLPKEEPKVDVQESIPPVEPQLEPPVLKEAAVVKEEQVTPPEAAKSEKVEEPIVPKPISPKSPKKAPAKSGPAPASPEPVKESAPPPAKPKLAKLKATEATEKPEEPKTPESAKAESLPESAQAEASTDVPKSDTKPKEVRKIKKKTKKVPKAEGETAEGTSKK